jgi:very-short-patch-repair endonuclease
MPAMKPYLPILKQAARNLRNDMTSAERILWSALRRKQLGGFLFYRQKPIGRFIVDFYCAAAGLVIELDGTHHSDAQQAAYDTERTQQLETLGLHVIRFNNQQVLTDIDAVLEKIFQLASSRCLLITLNNHP